MKSGAYAAQFAAKVANNAGKGTGGGKGAEEGKGAGGDEGAGGKKGTGGKSSGHSSMKRGAQAAMFVADLVNKNDAKE